jgi:RNA polymerase sigma-70 factor, ECF subfamily
VTAPITVTQLLLAWSDGDATALDRVVPLIYEELHRQARRYLRNEAIGHTLQPTALVHEVYLRLVEQHGARWSSRAQFFGVAAQLMRRILVDHARSRNAAKREGAAIIVPLDLDVPVSSGDVDLVSLDDALTRLSLLDMQQARIVELRYFTGLDIEETADVLGISPATVKRDWVVARAWLRRRLANEYSR